MAVSLAFSNLAFQFNNVKVVQNPVCFGLAPTKLPFLCKERRRLSSSRTITIPGASSAPTIEDGSQNDTDAIPTPKVIIDQDSDPNVTVVEITFGDRLGALLDTMNALKNLGLNVVKANVFLDSSGKHNTFSITKASTGRKVDDPELLEAIRLTIINNLLQYHPESSSQLAMGIAFGVEPPKQVDVDIATHIKVKDDSPDRRLQLLRDCSVTSDFIKPWSACLQVGAFPQYGNMQEGGGSGKEVTWEDQQNINKFGRLNNRFHELEDEIKIAKETNDNLEDASNELILTDEEVVRFQIGEVFAHVPRDEVETRIEQMKEVTVKNLEKLEEEKDSVLAQMTELKKILYGKFGDSINLEED